MATPSPGYSITVRVEAPTDPAATARLSRVVAEAGGAITALDVAESHPQMLVVDVVCNASDVAHSESITKAIAALEGFSVRKVSDRTFLLHLGGKIEVNPKVALKHRDDLSRAYTPGVARVCLAIAENPADARRLTIKRNTVAVVTDGSAVLGLGNIGPAAALPVMEGKAALFKRFAGVDAWPVCLDTQDSDKIVEIVKAIAPVYGGVNLEDISAPRCFEIEERLRAELDIPVFHDDQHGTAIVVLAALINALRVVGQGHRRRLVRGLRRRRGRVGDHPAAASGRARPRSSAATARARCTTRRQGRRPCGSGWSTTPTPRSGPARSRRCWSAPTCSSGSPRPTSSTATTSPAMATDAIVFGLANPIPEVDPLEAQQHAAVVATGRSDFPNQINNVLAFPGFFRGLLDGNLRDITDEMLSAAANAIADRVAPSELNASYIIPSVFDASVAPAVAAAVREVGAASH